MKSFRGLPRRQLACFEQIATGATGDSFSRRTTAALASKGLIVGHEFPMYGGGNIPLMCIQWSVPLDVHMEWCHWCSENAGSGAPSVAPQTGGKDA